MNVKIIKAALIPVAKFAWKHRVEIIEAVYFTIDKINDVREKRVKNKKSSNPRNSNSNLNDYPEKE